MKVVKRNKSNLVTKTVPPI